MFKMAVLLTIGNIQFWDSLL